MGKYDDIIDIPYEKSKKHAHMPVSERAAMFAPFRALTGHSDAVLDAEKITFDKIILDEDKKSYLDSVINMVKDDKDLIVSITYFIKDGYKKGGRYNTITSSIKKIDALKREVVLKSGNCIPLDDILNIEIEKH